MYINFSKDHPQKKLIFWVIKQVLRNYFGRKYISVEENKEFLDFFGDKFKTKNFAAKTWVTVFSIKKYSYFSKLQFLQILMYVYIKSCLKTIRSKKGE